MGKTVKSCQKYVSAKLAVSDNLPKPNLETIKQMQIAAQECLQNYSKKDETAEFPKELAFDLSIALLDLLSGEKPFIFRSPPRGRGKKIAGYDQIKYKKEAVAYIVYSQKGLISDHDPMQTIMKNYEVKRRTVQDWVKQYKNGIRTPQKITARKGNQIKKIMETSGRHYTNSQRASSGNAIDRRGRADK